MPRYDATARLGSLRRLLREERQFLARLYDRLRNFAATDKRGWTHYDYAHFQGVSKQDIRAAIGSCESRIRDLEREIADAERRHGLDDDDPDLVY